MQVPRFGLQKKYAINNHPLDSEFGNKGRHKKRDDMDNSIISADCVAQFVFITPQIYGHWFYETSICENIKNSTLVQFVLGNHLLFVENSDIMVDV